MKRCHLGHIHLNHLPHPQPPSTALQRLCACPVLPLQHLSPKSFRQTSRHWQFLLPCGPTPFQCRGDQLLTAPEAQFLSYHGSCGSEAKTCPYVLERGGVSHPKARLRQRPFLRRQSRDTAHMRSILQALHLCLTSES